MGAAPEDVEILEFAMEWRINPETIRHEWTARDFNWLRTMQRAKRLAIEELQRRAGEKT